VTTKILGLIALVPTALIALFLVFQSNEGDLATQTKPMITESKPAEIVKVIPTTTPTSSPTPVKSPTPSLNVELDDKKIIGNLLYGFNAYIESGYVEFLLFSDDFESKDNRVSYLFYENEGIGPTIESQDSLTPERWNQVRNLIIESVSVDVDSGAGFSKWENQSVSCNEFRDCYITLFGFREKFMGPFNSKQVIRIKYNVSNEDQLKDVDLYSTNGSMDVLTFEPASCLTIYNKMINPPKGFDNINEVNNEYRSDLYDLLKNIDGC
jgi:hypothetical protein